MFPVFTDLSDFSINIEKEMMKKSYLTNVIFMSRYLVSDYNFTLKYVQRWSFSYLLGVTL